MYSLNNKTVSVAVECTHMHINVPLHLWKHMQLNDQHVHEKSNLKRFKDSNHCNTATTWQQQKSKNLQQEGKMRQP